MCDLFCLLQATATASCGMFSCWKTGKITASPLVNYLKASNEGLKGGALFSCSIYPFRLFFYFVCLFVCLFFSFNIVQVPTCVLACSTEDVEVRPAKAGAESDLSNDFSINFRRSCRRTFTGDLTKLRRWWQRQNNNSAGAPRFFANFFAVPARLRREMTKF